MSNNEKLLSKTSKNIKDVYKTSDEFESDTEVNYCENYKVKKRKLKCSKKKPCDRKEFLKEDKSKFDTNSEDDTGNSKDDNFTDFDKHDLDPDKSLDFEKIPKK